MIGPRFLEDETSQRLISSSAHQTKPAENQLRAHREEKVLASRSQTCVSLTLNSQVLVVFAGPPPQKKDAAA